MAAPTDAELLAAVKTALGGTLSRNAASYQINGRNLSSIPIADLLLLRNDLEARVARASRGGYSDVVVFRGEAS